MFVTTECALWQLDQTRYVAALIKFTALRVLEQVMWSLSNFVLLMLQHPDIQAAAQEELDRVVGRHRLPDVSDRESLPFVTAVMYEVLR